MSSVVSRGKRIGRGQRVFALSLLRLTHAAHLSALTIGKRLSTIATNAIKHGAANLVGLTTHPPAMNLRRNNPMFTIYSAVSGLPVYRRDGSTLTVSLAAANCIVARNPWLFFYPSDIED